MGVRNSYELPHMHALYFASFIMPLLSVLKRQGSSLSQGMTRTQE